MNEKIDYKVVQALLFDKSIPLADRQLFEDVVRHASFITMSHPDAEDTLRDIHKFIRKWKK